MLFYYAIVPIKYRIPYEHLAELSVFERFSSVFKIIGLANSQTP